MNEPAVFLPRSALPENSSERDRLLQDYVAERVPHSSRTGSGDWVVRLAVPPSADYYIDPELDSGLRWWGPGTAIADVPFAHKRVGGVGISLSDAWTLAFWSDYFAQAGGVPARLTVLHLDDHDDLMTPRLATSAGGSFTDLVTGHEFTLTEPAGVRSAIGSGAIGMGSFLTPVLHTAEHTRILHLCDTRYAAQRQGEFSILAAQEADALFRPGSPRPAARLVPGSRNATDNRGSYQVDSDLPTLLSHLTDDPVFLHIDLDYFNNRFDGDSDWHSAAERHDPPRDRVLDRVETVLAQLRPIQFRIVDVTIGISPGFFPAEFWQPVCEKLLGALSSI
ncbi:hypothetical protein [Amycolatopsis sp. DG1A-15b]|uniref:hypothetical protein n=1 Tax=Amycolatopsis sp. DG1A-15b TaxID=3052846 RepID=UPI00255BBA78|nr:hypothetical protein [Amycolatopsis sp. DG1A-15b]WIX92530.1 hypothetical protein QRY02_19655 [Amycolatopsis sp. DG1A-15b]